MTDIARLQLEVDTRKLKEGERELDRFGKQSSKTASDVDRASAGIVTAFNRVGGALVTAFSLGELVKVADTYSSINAQLRLVTQSTAELAEVEAKLFQMAQANRVGFESTAELYARIARSTEALGVSQEQALRVTDTINKALIISGTSAQTASGALMQLGQAFASGTLRGDELNSVLEGMPRVAQAIADGMGVTVGELRALGAQGELTGEQVFNALLKMSQGIDQEFARMPTTVGQSFTILGNSVLRMIGVFDQANNVSSSFANAVVSVARVMDGAGGSVRTLISVVSSLVGGFAAYRLTLVAVTAAQAAYTTVMIAATRAIGAAQAGTLGLNAALAANPFTAVAAAVGILAASFIGLANAQAQARAETNNLITSLRAAAQARSADFLSRRAELQGRLSQEEARLRQLRSEQANVPRGMQGGLVGALTGSGADRANEALAAQNRVVSRLRLELGLADEAYAAAGKAAESMVVPTGQAAQAVSGLGKSLGTASAAARSATDDFAELMEALYPENITRRQMQQLDQIEQFAGRISNPFQARLRALGVDEATVSRDLLNQGPLEEARKVMAANDDIGKSLDELTGKTKTQTVQIAESFAQMSQRITSSIQGLANSIRSGDFIGILGGVLDIFTQLGSAGVFGSGLAGRLNAAPSNRSMGGPVYAGSPYIVGENGPELFTPPGTGRIVANDNLAKPVQVMVGIDPRNGNVTAFVDNRIVTSAPLVANAGAQQAQALQARSNRRRVR